MSNSPSFPNMPTDQSLPEISVSDPNGTSAPDQSAGGQTKISPSATPPHPTEQEGHGYQSPDLKNVEMAPSGENSSGIPAAQPITPQTFGDPNSSAGDFPSK